MEEPVARPAEIAVMDVDTSSAAIRTRYEDDLHSWAREQVALLRARRFDEIDVERVAEELEDVSRREFSKLYSCLRVLLMHMLKWDQQPEHRTPSWIYSIREQRRRFDRLLTESPSLKARLEEALAQAYLDARDWAADETHLMPDEFPSACPYSWDEIRARPFDLDSAKK
jgi:hypothetical protein